MPPNHVSSTACEGPRTGRFDRSIPPTRVIETREWRDNQVNVQLGPFVALPVVGFVLVLRPEHAELIMVWAGLAVAALRRSQVHYQQVRWN